MLTLKSLLLSGQDFMFLNRNILKIMAANKQCCSNDHFDYLKMKSVDIEIVYVSSS